MKQALDEKMYRKGTRSINRTFYRLRMLVLIAVTTGMRQAEIFGLNWMDVMYSEGLLAVRGKAEGRQDALRPNASRTCWRAAAVCRRYW